jgi:hypothetical protein
MLDARYHMKLSLESLAVFSRSSIMEGDGTRAAEVGDGVRERVTIIASNLTSIGGGVSSASEVRRVVPRRGAKRVAQPQRSPCSASRLLADIEDAG